MSRRTNTRKRRDARIFARTARKTKSVNVITNMRGGIRL